VQVQQAFRFELAPNDHARSQLRSHAGAARFVYGWGLRLVKGALGARSTCEHLALRNGATMAEAKAWGAEVVGPVPWSFYGLRKRWDAEKDIVAPWWRECSKRTFAYGLANLANAFTAVLAAPEAVDHLGQRPVAGTADLGDVRASSASDEPRALREVRTTEKRGNEPGYLCRVGRAVGVERDVER
jgi:hypothetical protein